MQAHGGRGPIHVDVVVMPHKNCPRRRRERQEQSQCNVARKRMRIQLGFVHLSADFGRLADSN